MNECVKCNKVLKFDEVYICEYCGCYICEEHAVTTPEYCVCIECDEKYFK